MNPEFKKLIDSLQIKYLLLVENDFKPLDDAEKILSFSSVLPDFEQKYLIEDIKKINNDLSDKMSAYFIKFERYRPTSEEINISYSSDGIQTYLSKKPRTNTIIKLTNNLIKKIEKDISNDSSIKDIFLKYAVADNIPSQFNFFIHEIRENNKSIRIRLLNNLDTEPIEDILSNIEKVLKETKTDTYLAVVDKKMGLGKNGIEFIEKDLKEFNDYNKYKSLSVILTSSPDSNDINDMNNYYKLEVNKESENFLTEIFQFLLLCSYRIFFYFLKNCYSKGVEGTFEISMKNPKNIIYILENANKDGTSPYEAITKWFHLVLHYKTNDEIKKEYEKFFVFLKYFNSNFPVKIESEAKIGNELKDINTYEIFDYSINEKYLPIESGDVFKNGDKYFLLLGQSCDISLREDNIRKNNIAELIEIKTILLKDLKDKYKIDDKYKVDIDKDENKQVVYLKYFCIDDEWKAIKIILNNCSLCDFRILDCCMYSKKGYSIIETDSDISDDIKRLLPNKKDGYYKTLKTLGKKIISQKSDFLDTINDFLKPFDFSLFNANIEKNKIDWNFIRICRIKEPFISAIYDNYINHKRRTGLNMVDNAPEIVKKIDLQYSFFEDEDKKKIEINLWEKNGKKYIKKNELLDEIAEEFKFLLSKIDTEEMYFGNEKKEYKLVIEESKACLLFAFYIENIGDYHKKSKINYKQLFKLKDDPANKNITFLDTNKSRLIDNNGFSIINDLSRKIKFAEKNKTVSYKNGIIKIEE